MTLSFLSGLAALSEHVYRRADSSQAITLTDIGATVAVTNPALVQIYRPQLQLDAGTYFYNNATGFLGAIVSFGGRPRACM